MIRQTTIPLRAPVVPELDEGAIRPPDDVELWCYTNGTGRWFLQLSAFSRGLLGMGLMFLGLRGYWLALLFPVAVMMVVGAVVSLIWSFHLSPFDRSDHEARREAAGDWRRAAVDVFITTCGEDPLVIRNTILHATRMIHAGPVRVHVLDDKGVAEVREHAEALGAHYLHRPNPGWMKKSGNLHHGYQRTDGEFIVVLDADFAPRTDFLQHTLPYLADPGVGIVQTPQYFRVDRDNWVECGAASQQEQFYRIVQRARDRRGGAICVGTNAVYRRAALDARGGMALLEHSEDLFTGMKVIDAGYRISYLPLVLAAGSAPSTTKSLGSQQYRWARGTFALAGTPLFKRLRLTFMQRMSIWDGWIFYASSALSPVVAILASVLTLAEAPGAVSLSPALMLVPALVTEFVVQPRWLFLADGSASRRVGLISQVAHLFALRDHLSDREQEWVPTGEVGGGRRQATDRIPELIAAGGFWGFLVTMSLVGVRVAEGYSIVDLAPLVALAVLALPTAMSVTKDPIRSHVPAAQSVERDRDGFLDTVRAISIIRVMFWHAMAFWWISWVFAAMPATFYVSGALVAKSLRRRSPLEVVRARLRRLVPPYAVFVAASLVAVLVAEPSTLRTHRLDLLSWIVPFQSPARLPWEDGWLSTPLWFLRALILVLFLVPLGCRVARRLHPLVWLGGWSAALVVLDVLVAHQHSVRATSVLRGLGDIVCFGGFFALGVAVHHRRDQLAGTRRKVLLLVGLSALTAAVTVVAPPPDRVVNNSNVTMALVGSCWLVALLLGEHHLRRLGEVPGIGRVLGWVASNSMTVYLWHTTVLCITFAIVGMPESPEGWLLFGTMFAPLLVVAVMVLRPFEHRWSGTKDRARHPVRPVWIAAAATVGLLLSRQPTLFPATVDTFALPAPSARPEVGGATRPDDATSASGSGDGIRRWMAANGVQSAAVVVGRADGSRRVAVYDAGDDTDDHGQPGRGQRNVDLDERFEVLSVTKTMVAAVALQLVDEGRLTLDGPLPAIDGVPEELTDGETIRRLLAHASGLVDYRMVPKFRATTKTDPAAAVLAAYRISDIESREVSYAATNYFLVGLAIEEVTGTTLAAQLEQRIFRPLRLDDTSMIDNSRPGFVGFGSAGVVSTLDDLATWYDALLGSGKVLDRAMVDEMLWGGQAFAAGTGLGAWRHCPCTAATPSSRATYAYAFHDGGDVRVMYFPNQGDVVVARFSKSLYLSPPLANELDGFAYQVIARLG